MPNTCSESIPVLQRLIKSYNYTEKHSGSVSIGPQLHVNIAFDLITITYNINFRMDSLDSTIVSLDFDPNGEIASTIDLHGRCLISMIETNGYSFHMKLGDIGGNHFSIN